MPTTRVRGRRSHSPARFLGAVLAALMALLIAACSSSAGDFDSGAGGDSGEVGDTDSGVQNESSVAGDEARPGSGTVGTESDVPDPESSTGPMLIRRLTMEVVVDDVVVAVDRTRATVLGANGWISSQDVRPRTEGRAGTASLVLRVPSGQLDRIEEDLSGLGQLTSSRDTAEDVAAEYRDLEARLATMEASVDRVRDLIAEANDIDGIVRLERELSSREADLDALKARLQVLSEDVARSTVTLHLAESSDDLEAIADRPGFVGGLQAGWSAFVTSVSLLLTALGATLPFAVAFTLVAVPILWWRRRRTDAKAAKTTATTAPTRPAPQGDPVRQDDPDTPSETSSQRATD